MRKITLFYDGAWYTLKWFKVMLWAKDFFYDNGYDVSFLNDSEYEHSYNKIDVFENSVQNNEFDIVFIACHDSHTGLCSIDENRYHRIMTQLRSKSNFVVWLDTSDSAGGIWSRALPYVDKYLRKQIYSNTGMYMDNHWGGDYIQTFIIRKN